MSFPRGSWALLVAICLLTFSFSNPAFGQGARIDSLTDPDVGRDDPAGREAWFMRGRIPPAGQSAAALRLRADQQKMQMRAARRISAFSTQSAAVGAAGVSQWVPLGPAPLASDASGTGAQDYGFVSGRATSVLIDPADNTGNTVYVGGAFGGLWRSQNAGSLSATPGSVSWTPIIDNQPTLAVGAIALQPGNVDAVNKLSKMILVGTGEANSSGDSYYGLGISRSTDAGATWSLITSDATGTHSFKGVAFSKIAFSTANPNLVVAATAGSFPGASEGLENPINANRGIYYSTNAGATWSYASIKDGATTVDPGSVTSVVYSAAAGRFFAAMRRHGFYSSSDGVNWTRLAAQPAPAAQGLNSTALCPAAANTTCPIYRGEIGTLDDKTNPLRNEMYVWYVNVNDVNQGIWRSTNSGTSWSPVSMTGVTSCGDSAGCGTVQGSYNLEVKAIPNGAATDLYVGAVNVFKCSIPGGTNPALCNQVSPSTNRFLNLTHVYGCSPVASISHVHPDQHGLDAMIASGKAVLYFANDGGIYRALDGFTGLTNGTCGQTNQFDNLNQTLGSMTQFVSFSSHPSDPATLLGGTQDNGSPATTQAEISSSWFNVNGGDGAHPPPNPNNPLEWFTANFNVSIQRCALGSNCRDGNFQTIVNKATVGGDNGPFYTPYILDPQNSSALLVGTCRIWRGSTSGTGFAALSPNFDTQTSAICPTPSATVAPAINQVHAIAVGGAKDGSGSSSVIYAGTEGLGPLTGSGVTGGHVWVTTNAIGGLWQDRTPFTNSVHYTIGDIAVDSSDGSGNTAFVGVMGFGTAHVLKTINAGVSWTDFSGSSPFALPDAPVNSLLVDIGAAVVYAGTDVGVFASPMSAPSWTEVGPAAQPGNTGYLPNVPVTRLRLFSSGGVKKLRASTYGRGIWEFPLTVNPDYKIVVSTPALANYPAQPVTYNGTLIALDGYSSPVNLTCTAGATAAPSCNPTSVTPTPPPGTAFGLSAQSSTVGDYSFNLHAVGTDAGATTHNATLALSVFDFGLTAPSPATITGNIPNPTNATAFSVTASGSFNDGVQLLCGNTPAGTTCLFSNPIVRPTAGNPVPVTLTVDTSGAAGASSSTIQILADGESNPAPARKAQNLTLNITANPDFTVSGGGSQSATINQPLQIPGVLTARNGYNKSVNLSCTAGATAPPTCAFNPASLTPTSGGASFTLTVTGNTVKTYDFDISGADGTLTHKSHVSLTVNPDFSISNGSGSQTVKSGQSATYTLSIAPVGAATLGSDVTYSCTAGLPALTSCAFSPTTVSAGSGATPVTLTISTTGGNSANIPPVARLRNPLWFTLAVSLFGFVFATSAGKKRHWRRQIGMALTVVPILIFVACGGGGSSPPPPPPPVSVTISPASGVQLFPGQTQKFTATVHNSSNPSVAWQVNNVAGGDATNGTIDTTGLYAAPAAVPNPASVTVKAVAQADSTKSASSNVAIKTPTAIGTYNITITATSAGVSHPATATLIVQ